MVGRRGEEVCVIPEDRALSDSRDEDAEVPQHRPPRVRRGQGAGSNEGFVQPPTPSLRNVGSRVAAGSEGGMVVRIGECRSEWNSVGLLGFSDWAFQEENEAFFWIKLKIILVSQLHVCIPVPVSLYLNTPFPSNALYLVPPKRGAYKAGISLPIVDRFFRP